MINKKKETKAYKDAFEKAIQKLRSVGFDNIKADFEGYDIPAKLVNQAAEITFIPDITAVSDGRKHYFEISQKGDPKDLLKSKWKLLETMASVRNGEFKVFAPKGHIKFTEEFVNSNNINAEIIRI